MDYKKIAVIVIVIVIILVGVNQRTKNKRMMVDTPTIAQEVQKQEILTAEEIAQVRAQQELVLKEAENLKIKDQILKEKEEAIKDYDTRLAQVEKELSSIRSGKLSFQSRLRQSVSQGPSTKQNAGPQVSVLTKEDLERLGIISSYQQPGVPTR